MSRTTRRPSSAGSMTSWTRSAWSATFPSSSTATRICASIRAWARAIGSHSGSVTTTSASRSSPTAHTVSSPGSPGPAATSDTWVVLDDAFIALLPRWAVVGPMAVSGPLAVVEPWPVVGPWRVGLDAPWVPAPRSASISPARRRPTSSACSTGPVLDMRTSEPSGRARTARRWTVGSGPSSTSASAPMGAEQPASRAARSERSATTAARVCGSSRERRATVSASAALVSAPGWAVLLPSGPVTSATDLDREGALTRGGHDPLGVDQLGDAGPPAEARQAGSGEDDGVQAPGRTVVGHAGHPGVDVPADVDDLEVGPGHRELGAAPGGPGADPGADGKRLQRGSVAGHQGVAGVLPGRDRRQVQALVGSGRQVLERVHGHVGPTVDEGLADSHDEHAGAADLGQGRLVDVAARGHLDQLAGGARSGPPGARRPSSTGPSPGGSGGWQVAGGSAATGEAGGAGWALIAGPRAHAGHPVAGSRSADGSTTDAGSDGSRSKSADSASA